MSRLSGSFSASFATSGSAASASASTYSRSASKAGGPSAELLSQLEQAIINAQNKPVEINETEQITANGVTGIHANKQETAHLDLSKYELFNDPNPQIIRKQLEKIKHKQEISIKYLRPPPVKAGNIIIKQEPDTQEQAAPPLVIRQEGKKAQDEGPIVIREAPPKTPCPVGEKVITIPGKTLPPPPRKVVIEKLPDIPAKPRNVIIEKWLPYEEPVRKVVFQRSCPVQPAPAPQNVVVQWESPEVEVSKEFKDLGVVEADPKEYRQRYQFNKKLNDLPAVYSEVANNGSATPKPSSGAPRLEGDLHALAYIDLDKEGLSHYRSLVQGSSE